MTLLANRRFAAQAGLALVVANVRYWWIVAPVVRRELGRWAEQAEAIGDRDLRTLALEKLRGEGFHAEAAAMLATIAPREHRRQVVEAIVALELLYDYLDGLTERASADPLRDGERLFAAYIDAVAPRVGLASDEAGEDSRLKDGGYLEALSGAIRAAVARLPAVGAVAGVAQRSAARSAQAQIRMHAAPQLGVAQLEQWATGEAEGSGLAWRELAAGAASSVLAVHALIVAAADASTTAEDAVEIEAVYLSSCVVLTLLDGLVDYEEDVGATGAPRLGYLGLYEDRGELARVVGESARRAVAQARQLPNGAHHVMLLVGVVGYYGSAAGARSAVARPVLAELRAELRPLLSPTLAVMRAWRAAKQARGRGSWRGAGETRRAGEG
jgi:tetraprenyl-beta-curcumene synthase